MSDPDPDAIVFRAILNKISTTIDGGWRVTFDVSQSDQAELLKLSSLRQETLKVVILDPFAEFSSETQRGRSAP